MNLAFPALLAVVLASLPVLAHAQATRVNRCADAQGQSVYTDRPCDSLGARSRQPPPAPAGAIAQRDTLGAQCPRRLSELVQAVQTAVATRDVNRLSTLYLWGAVSDAGAQRILGQLESVVRRPLVDVVPVYPQEVVDAGHSPAQQGSDAEGTEAPDPEAPARRHPVGLRLEQTLPGSATRAATVVGLRRQYGCFWITL